MPGRYCELRLASEISCASSGRLAHIITWEPPSTRILPNVVPQLPAPITAARVPVPSGERLGVKTPRLVLTVLRRIPASFGCLLSAKLLQQGCDRIHQTIGGLVQRARLPRAPSQIRQVDR